MKRNEMIQIMKIASATGPSAVDMDKYLGNILDAMEKAGMKPPHISEEDAQAAMQVYYGGFSYNQWDEDLLKDEELQKAKEKRTDAKAARFRIYRK